ncbi:hypothetical protein, partial [Prevotella multiformis]|uniref:hypothetical protein n=1 Tax=Prevotella multiformis TaxID=282402 RepID=UPI0028DBAB95
MGLTKIIFFSKKDKAIQKILLQNPSQTIITAYYCLSPLIIAYPLPIIASPPYNRLTWDSRYLVGIGIYFGKPKK